MTERGARHRSKPTDPSTKQSTPSESSVMFSLRELMSLESDRIEDERAQEERARIEAQRAKMEAELRLAAAEEARRRAEAERALAEEGRKREEAARLEAIRLGELERARLEALEQSRLQQLEVEHKHAAEILRLKGDRDRVRLKRSIVTITIGTVVFAAAGIGYYVGVLRPRMEAEQRALADRSAQLDKERKARADDLAELDAERSRLQRDLDAIPTTAPAVTVTPVVTAQPTVTPRPPPTVKPPPPPPPTATGKCNPLDPMDECVR
ncbi:MAG: hypothetical protein HOW73_08895 [Polyangiaceae bacterium]|nr:hypothetical protein [Polyangiaceae bacterium]